MLATLPSKHAYCVAYGLIITFTALKLLLLKCLHLPAPLVRSIQLDKSHLLCHAVTADFGHRYCRLHLHLSQLDPYVLLPSGLHMYR